MSTYTSAQTPDGTRVAVDEPCPACGGNGWKDGTQWSTVGGRKGVACPDCVDGRRPTSWNLILVGDTVLRDGTSDTVEIQAVQRDYITVDETILVPLDQPLTLICGETPEHRCGHPSWTWEAADR